MGSVLLTQHCSGDNIVKNAMGWACSAYGESRDIYRVLVGKPEGKIHTFWHITLTLGLNSPTF